MLKTKFKFINIFISVIILIFAMMSASAKADAYFLVDSLEEWQTLLDQTIPENDFIRPMSPTEWEDFEIHRIRDIMEGEEVPSSQFLPPELIVYEGDNNPDDLNYPDEPGLIMGWGDDNLAEDNYSSGWVYQYGVDPDLTNCTISLKVHPPPAITMVSFALVDMYGNQCSWTWFTPANIPNTPPNPATTITINTNNIPGMGVNSSAPAAASFSCSPAFDITKVVSISINETFHNTPGVYPAPNPGAGATKFYWNAWDEFVVKPNSGGGSGQVNTKWFVKYSQPPVEVDEGLIDGWDQKSLYRYDPDTGHTFVMAADDWVCKDPRPVTDFHWWGSFIGWTQPAPPPVVPDYFKICIWKDIPKNAPGPDGTAVPYSRPAKLLWKHDCYKWVWNFAGYDLDPRWQFSDLQEYDRDKLGDPQENEACFQFNQLLSQDEYFRQEPMEDGQPNIYWLSIAAVYLNTTPDEIKYPWGWKTRPFDPDKAPDAAGVITDVDILPFTIGSTTVNGFFPLCLPNPDWYPEGQHYDLCFELTTNQPAYKDDPIPGDIAGPGGDDEPDGTVDMNDLAVLAANWLRP